MQISSVMSFICGFLQQSVPKWISTKHTRILCIFPDLESRRMASLWDVISYQPNAATCCSALPLKDTNKIYLDVTESPTTYHRWGTSQGNASIVPTCWVSLFLQMTSDRMRRNELKYCHVLLILRKTSSLRGWSGIGTCCPGKWWYHHPWKCSKGVFPKKLYLGTQYIGEYGEQLEIMILEVFFNRNDSMILWSEKQTDFSWVFFEQEENGKEIYLLRSDHNVIRTTEKWSTESWMC